MVEYKEKDLLGGQSIAVLVKGVTLGRIRKHGQDGSFVYYKGPQNQMNWSLQDRDLGALKAKFEATLK
jgi:hypothetical protein